MTGAEGLSPKAYKEMDVANDHVSSDVDFAQVSLKGEATWQRCCCTLAKDSAKPGLYS